MPDDTDQVQVLFVEQYSHTILYFHALRQVARRSTKYQRSVHSQLFSKILFGNSSVSVVDLKPRPVRSRKLPKVGVVSTSPASLPSTVLSHKQSHLISKKLMS